LQPSRVSLTMIYQVNHRCSER